MRAAAIFMEKWRYLTKVKMCSRDAGYLGKISALRRSALKMCLASKWT